MGGRSDDSRCGGQFASPPCLAADVFPDYFDPLSVDPQQALDVVRWRKAERDRLRQARKAIPTLKRQEIAERISGSLTKLLEQRSRQTSWQTISFYWPIKDEPDLRPVMKKLHAAGKQIALPVVEVKASPLLFRHWEPGTPMERGFWGIPVPKADAAVIRPDIVLAPLVGWDSAGYRLGYGGGYFDRTLASLSPQPFSVGIGLHASKLQTIFPQPHDIPLDAILTEDSVEFERAGIHD